MNILERSVPFELRNGEEGDGLTLSGYAAVFNEPTQINSWEGTFLEQIRKGAFRKTIRERTPVLQFDHGKHPLIGSLPIGVIDSLREDDQGLAVEARLTDNWLVQPVREAIRDGAISGMSFRFEVIRDEWRDVNGKLVRDDELFELLWDPGDRGPITRTLIEVKLHELGPVVFPAYPQTSVGVRAREIASMALSDPDWRKSIRKNLARGMPNADELRTEPELAKQVATALLFGIENDGAPLAEKHPPSEKEEAREEKEDAPLTEEHPSDNLSRIKPDRIKRDAENMAAYLALIQKGSERYNGDK